MLACDRDAAPIEKLGTPDLLEAERVREPRATDLPPLWARLFVLGAAWTYPVKNGTEEVRCRVIDVAEVFGGWRTQLSCEPAFPLAGIYVGSHDRLWRTDKAIEDIRELEDAELVLTAMPEPAAHVRANRGDWCFGVDDAMLCLRADVGIAGGLHRGVRWGTTPTSW